MKKISVSVLIIILLAGCGSGGADTPADAVKAFETAYNQLDKESVMALMLSPPPDGTYRALPPFDALAVGEFSLKIDVLDERITGNDAEADVRITMVLTGVTQTSETTMKLKSVDGRWFISD